MSNYPAAIVAQKIAIRHYQELAKVDPQMFFNTKIVTVAVLLIITLLETGKLKEAVALCEKVLPLRRALASQLPEVFGPGLALHLVFTGSCRKELGLIELACKDFAAAAAAVEALASATPGEAMTAEIAQFSTRINSEY